MGDAWAKAELNGGRIQPKRTNTTTETAPTTEADQPYTTLLVDMRNGFNDPSHKAALWTVQHRWPAGTFAFNCYRHAAQLIIQCNGRPCSVILSQEGVTQGDPISMVIYGVALTPLTEMVQKMLPDTLQAWYTDDSSFGGTAPHIAAAMRVILEKGPARGYFPEPSKSILICNLAIRVTVQAELEELASNMKTDTATWADSSAHRKPRPNGSNPRSPNGPRESSASLKWPPASHKQRMQALQNHSN